MAPLKRVSLTDKTTQLNYTLVYDNSNLADDAARQKDMDNRRARFTKMLENMKVLSEGGTLPTGALGGAEHPGLLLPRSRRAGSQPTHLSSVSLACARYIRLFHTGYMPPQRSHSCSMKASVMPAM